MDKPQLIICGSIAIDRIMNFSGRYQDLILRNKLDVLSVSVLLDTMEVSLGGIGANIAYSSAMLGEKPVLLGSVGTDAEAYIAELSVAGIDTSHVHVSHLATASFNVMTDSEDNQVGGFYPGAMADSMKLSLKPWAGQNVFFCLSAHDPAAMRTQVEQCRTQQTRLLYDPGQQVNNISGTDLLAGISAAELVIINEYEHGVLCHKTKLSADSLLARVPLLVITRGNRGSIIQSHRLKKPLIIQSTEIDGIIDPTGAGDAYRAGFLYGYLRQWELSKCGKLGSVIASLILEHSGTRYDFSAQQVTTRYRGTYQEELVL